MEPQLNKVVMMNMAGDREYLHQRYPVGVAYVISVEPFEVCWFQLRPSQLLPRVGNSASDRIRPFKTTTKFLTFEKYWMQPNWWKKRKGPPPSDEEIMSQWYKSKADKNWILDIDVPQPEAAKVRKSDQFKVPMEWATNTLVPALIAAACVHK